MPLKVKLGTHQQLPKPQQGVSYHSHFEPVVAMTTSEKSVKGQAVPAGLQMTEMLHPGVLGDGTKIMVEAGRTINLGNFESARILVSITVPCEQATIEETYQWATDWVSNKMEEALKDTKGTE